MPNPRVPAAAEGMPAIQSPPPEEPHARARRLAEELAETLNETFNGRCGADVYPSKALFPCFPAGFFDLHARRLMWQRGRWAQNYLKRLRRMTPDERVEHYTERLRRALAAQSRRAAQ